MYHFHRRVPNEEGWRRKRRDESEQSSGQRRIKTNTRKTMNSSTTAAGRQMFEGVGAPVNLNRIDARMDPTLDACCQREVRRFSSILDAIILCCLLSSCFLIFSEVPAHHRSPRRGGGGPSIQPASTAAASTWPMIRLRWGMRSQQVDRIMFIRARCGLG